MRKVLLIDTNFSSAPIYNFLVRSGYEVFVVGGNPGDYLAKSVKNYICLNYSNIDQSRELIGKMNIDYIVPGCNDVSYKVCAELNSDGRYFGLDSADNTEVINSKNLFREFATRIGLPVPRIIDNNQIGDVRQVIIKPVDAYSGRGMTVIRTQKQEDLKIAMARAKEFSPSGKILVEEYVEGQLYSHSAFIADGNVIADFIVEEHGTANPFVVDTSRVIYDFPRDMLDRIRDCIITMVKELKLVDGLMHTQFIKKGESFWLIEITRRCPGDLYSQLIELTTGFSYAEAYTRPFIDQKNVTDSGSYAKHWVMRHTISRPDEGIMGSIQFNYPVLIEKMLPICLAGDTIKASPFGRVALIFLRSKSENDLLEIYQAALSRNLYTLHDQQ